MTRVVVLTERAPQPKGAYSQAIVANGLLFTAGFGPHDPSNGNVVGSTIEEQTSQVLRNVEAVLSDHDLGWVDVVKSTVHLADLARDFAGFNATYERVVVAPYPVRTTVGSTLAGILVEIDVVAALRG